MIFFFFKLVMLALAYHLYTIKKEPYFSALFYSISLAVIGLLLGNSLIGVFIGSAILFALAFGCFWLLNKVPKGIPHYSVMAGTCAIVILFV